MTKTKNPTLAQFKRAGLTVGRIAEAFHALGIDLPAPLTKAVSEHATADERLRAVPEREALTPADLLADDWADRIDRHILAATARQRRGAAHRPLTQLAAAVTTCTRACAPDMLAALQDWYEAHYDDLADEGRADLHPARAAELTTLLHTFEVAHTALMPANTASAEPVAGGWFLRHAWTPRTWRALVDSTGPGYALHRGTNPYAVARTAGGTPRLAATPAEAAEAYERVRAGIDDEYARTHPGTRARVDAIASANARAYFATQQGSRKPKQ